MSELMVLGGTMGLHLAVRIAKLMNIELGDIEVKKFPDGETYIRVKSNVEGKNVIYINSLQRNPNDQVIETIYTLETLRDLGAEKVIAIIPYMAYARQDDRFNPGEAISIRILGKLFRSIKVDRIYTIDMHLHRIRDPREVFGEGFRNLTAVKELAKYVKKHYNLENTVVIGPDEESEQWAKIMAEELGVDFGVLEKRRITAEQVTIEAKGVNVKERDVVIVDDIISTGGTIEAAVKALGNLGARNIIVTCAHPLLVGNALPRLLKLNIVDLIGTDTVLSPISKVSVAPVLVEALKKDLKT